MITSGIRICICGLTKHVIGVSIAFCLHIFGTFHRFCDGFTQYELPAHFFHDASNSRPDYRLTHAFEQPTQMAHDTCLIIRQNFPS